MSDNQPITMRQKKTLVEVYTRTGNMARAMRESGIKSPRTAYLWWNRYKELGEAGLQPRSHARHTQKQLPEYVVEHICRIRREEPEWGRRQIASALTQHYGQQVASPAGVEAVLRRAGRWERPGTPAEPVPQLPVTPEWLVNGVDTELLMAAIESGIRLSLQSNARGGVQVLYARIWQPLETDAELRARLLNAPMIGSWLLASRLHLAHCLMNMGRWSQVAYFLDGIVAWVAEHPATPLQRAVEEGPHMISIRREDILLGAYEHLASVHGKGDVDRAVGDLQTAMWSIQRSHRPLVPSDQSRAGALQRNLAIFKLQGTRYRKSEIRDHLHQAQQDSELRGSSGHQAFVHMTWAKLHDRLAREASDRARETRRQERALMEQEIERATALVEKEQEDRPMRQTLCFVDAAELAYAHGIPLDKARVQRAAQHCATYGYGGQAKALVAVPGVRECLTEDEWRNLTAVASSG